MPNNPGRPHDHYDDKLDSAGNPLLQQSKHIEGPHKNDNCQYKRDVL